MEKVRRAWATCRKNRVAERSTTQRSDESPARNPSSPPNRPLLEAFTEEQTAAAHKYVDNYEGRPRIRIAMMGGRKAGKDCVQARVSWA